MAGDVADAIRIDDLRGIKIPYYDGNPSNLDDFIPDWEDFAEEVVGEMRGAPRDKLVCRTFPHRLAQDLKEELRDQIREGLIRTEQACLQWLEDEERWTLRIRSWRTCGPSHCRWTAVTCGSGSRTGICGSTADASSWWKTGTRPVRTATC